MNAHRTTPMLAALVALCIAAPTALATDIYKWTDENGIVHFGDRPSSAPAERLAHIQSDPTDSAQVQARVQARTAAEAPAAEAAQSAPAAAPTEEELRAQEQERVQRCAKLKEQLHTFLTSRRLYREDENGERVYLNEEETLAARAKVQQEIVDTCDR